MIAKICGITRRTDALHATEQGATALGFVFWPQSPRYIAPDKAAEIVSELPGNVTPVGVFVNQPITEIRDIARVAGITTIQLHGDEPADYATTLSWPVWRAISLGHTNGTLTGWPDRTVFLLDAHDPVRRGGTGTVLDWPAAAVLAAEHAIVLAGGLTPDNVGAAIRTVRPIGVDVSSGVESAPGIKDHARITSFLEHARAAFNGR